MIPAKIANVDLFWLTRSKDVLRVMLGRLALLLYRDIDHVYKEKKMLIWHQGPLIHVQPDPSSCAAVGLRRCFCHNIHWINLDCPCPDGSWITGTAAEPQALLPKWICMS